MSTIQNFYAREILDSRGLPTVECFLWLDNGYMVSAAAPSGTSKGKNEALEIRDNDPNRMTGQGVLTAVNNINQIIGPQLIGKDPVNQDEIDQLMIQLDGSENKSKLGANAIIAVSQAVCQAGALASGLQLYDYIHQKYQLAQQLFIPNCIYGIINGGQHGADNLDIQEFQIIPASHYDFETSLNIAVTIFNQFGNLLMTKGAIHSVGIVGGFAPNLYNNTDAFDLLIEAIRFSPYTFAQDIFFGVDMSANSFYQNNKYVLKDKSQPYSAKDLTEYYQTLRKQYHVFYMEDPFYEEDFQSWQQLTTEIGETTTIAADDLTVSNPQKLQAAIQQKAANAITIKPNQIGTITETMQVIKLARDAGWQVIISHRSGETNDHFLADLAVGVGAEYARFGPPNRGERTAKYNRLKQIASYLQQPATSPSTSTGPSQTESAS